MDSLILPCIPSEERILRIRTVARFKPYSSGTHLAISLEPGTVGGLTIRRQQVIELRDYLNEFLNEANWTHEENET